MDSDIVLDVMRAMSTKLDDAVTEINALRSELDAEKKKSEVYYTAEKQMVALDKSIKQGEATVASVRSATGATQEKIHELGSTVRAQRDYISDLRAELATLKKPVDNTAALESRKTAQLVASQAKELECARKDMAEMKKQLEDQAARIFDLEHKSITAAQTGCVQHTTAAVHAERAHDQHDDSGLGSSVSSISSAPGHTVSSSQLFDAAIPAANDVLMPPNSQDIVPASNEPAAAMYEPAPTQALPAHPIPELDMSEEMAIHPPSDTANAFAIETSPFAPRTPVFFGDSTFSGGFGMGSEEMKPTVMSDKAKGKQRAIDEPRSTFGQPSFPTCPAAPSNGLKPGARRVGPFIEEESSEEESHDAPQFAHRESDLSRHEHTKQKSKVDGYNSQDSDPDGLFVTEGTKPSKRVETGPSTEGYDDGHGYTQHTMTDGYSTTAGYGAEKIKATEKDVNNVHDPEILPDAGPPVLDSTPISHLDMNLSDIINERGPRRGYRQRQRRTNASRREGTSNGQARGSFGYSRERAPSPESPRTRGRFDTPPSRFADHAGSGRGHRHASLTTGPQRAAGPRRGLIDRYVPAGGILRHSNNSRSLLRSNTTRSGPLEGRMNRPNTLVGPSSTHRRGHLTQQQQERARAEHHRLYEQTQRRQEEERRIEYNDSQAEARRLQTQTPASHSNNNRALAPRHNDKRVRFPDLDSSNDEHRTQPASTGDYYSQARNREAARRVAVHARRSGYSADVDSD